VVDSVERVQADAIAFAIDDMSERAHAVRQRGLVEHDAATRARHALQGLVQPLCAKVNNAAVRGGFQVRGMGERAADAGILVRENCHGGWPQRFPPQLLLQNGFVEPHGALEILGRNFEPGDCCRGLHACAPEE